MPEMQETRKGFDELNHEQLVRAITSLRVIRQWVTVVGVLAALVLLAGVGFLLTLLIPAVMRMYSSVPY